MSSTEKKHDICTLLHTFITISGKSAQLYTMFFAEEMKGLENFWNKIY